MTGFTKVAFFEIQNDSLEELPTYDTTPIKLYDVELTNNISIEITSNDSSRSRKADNKVEELTAQTGYSAVLTVYGVSKEAQSKLLGCELDANQNLIMVANAPKKKFGMFYETQDSDGKKMQVYLSRATFGNLLPSAQTDEKGDPVSITIDMNGSLVNNKGKEVVGFQVFEGQEGFVSSGLPSKFYVPAEEAV